MVKLLLLLGGGYTDIPKVQQTGAHNVKLPAILHSLPLKVQWRTRPLQDPGIACRISLHMAVAHTAGSAGGATALAPPFAWRQPFFSGHRKEAILVGVSSGLERIEKQPPDGRHLCRNRRGFTCPFWLVEMWLQAMGRIASPGSLVV
jgi:hypothetical protein